MVTSEEMIVLQAAGLFWAGSNDGWVTRISDAKLFSNRTAAEDAQKDINRSLVSEEAVLMRVTLETFWSL